MNIADVLSMTVDEAVTFFRAGAADLRTVFDAGGRGDWDTSDCRAIGHDVERR